MVAESPKGQESRKMINRTTKFLLAVIAGALCLLLAHEFGGGIPVQAQSPVTVAQTPPAIVVDNNMVYILQNGTLSAYLLDSPTMEKMVPEAMKQKLRRVSSVKVQTAP